MRAEWVVRSANGRAARTAHLLAAGGRTLCGWSQTGGWIEAHAYSVRCDHCAKAEPGPTELRLVADEPAPDDFMESWVDEWRPR